MPIESSVLPGHRAEEVHAAEVGEHEGGFAAFVRLRERRGSRQESQRGDQDT